MLSELCILNYPLFIERLKVIAYAKYYKSLNIGSYSCYQQLGIQSNNTSLAMNA